VIYLATIIFVYQKHHPEDGQITGRNMLVKIHHKLIVNLLVVYTFCIGIEPFMFCVTRHETILWRIVITDTYQLMVAFIICYGFMMIYKPTKLMLLSYFFNMREGRDTSRVRVFNFPHYFLQLLSYLPSSTGFYE
jgi:hypothetical protein